MNAFDVDNAPESEPGELVVGDFWQWKRTDLGDYDNTLFTLSYVLRLGSGTVVRSETITAVASGDDYLVSVASSVSVLYVPGVYHYSIYLTRISDSNRLEIGRGTLTIKSNLAVDEQDPRSHARIMLGKIESIIENRAESDVDNYAIAGRSITKMSIAELREWRNHYRSEVQAEDDEVRRRNGKKPQNKLKVRFVQ